MVYGVDETTGEPGKRIAVGGVSLERAQFEAQVAAGQAVEDHEFTLDPHPQYQTSSEVITLIGVHAPVPRFATYWKWS